MIKGIADCQNLPTRVFVVVVVVVVLVVVATAAGGAVVVVVVVVVVIVVVVVVVFLQHLFALTRSPLLSAGVGRFSKLFLGGLVTY